MNKSNKHIRKVQPTLTIQIPISDSNHKYDANNKQIINNNGYNPRLGSTKIMLDFSLSKQKGSGNKRCTTQPEGSQFLTFSTNKNQQSLKFSSESKKHLQFDKLKFKKTKNDMANKIQKIGIRRQNSKELLVNLTPQRYDFIPTLQISQKVTPTTQKRSKNMSFINQQKTKSILHRTQATVGVMPPLCFTQRSNKRSSISQSKHKTQRQLSQITSRNIYSMNPSSSNQVYQRKISYLRTEPEAQEQVNGIEAQFEQFLKSSQSKISTSRRRKQKHQNPTIQFTKSKITKQKPIAPMKNKKYEYSNFYVQQINSRNSQIRANTSRQNIKTSEHTLNSYRSIKYLDTKLLSANTSKKNLHF